MQSPDSSCATENSRLCERWQRHSRWQMKHSRLLCARHHLCPSLCVSLHLLCISLLPCRKKHNSFVVYSSQSGSEMGVVSCFLCSPDSTDSDPVAPFDFLHVFLQETEQSHHHNNKSSLLSSRNMCWIFSSESSANSRSLMPKENTLMQTMWCKGYIAITERGAQWGSDWHRLWLLLGNKTA